MSRYTVSQRTLAFSYTHWDLGQVRVICRKLHSRIYTRTVAPWAAAQTSKRSKLKVTLSHFCSLTMKPLSQRGWHGIGGTVQRIQVTHPASCHWTKGTEGRRHCLVEQSEGRRCCLFSLLPLDLTHKHFSIKPCVCSVLSLVFSLVFQQPSHCPGTVGLWL